MEGKSEGPGQLQYSPGCAWVASVRAGLDDTVEI